MSFINQITQDCICDIIHKLHDENYSNFTAIVQAFKLNTKII